MKAFFPVCNLYGWSGKSLIRAGEGERQLDNWKSLTVKALAANAPSGFGSTGTWEGRVCIAELAWKLGSVFQALHRNQENLPGQTWLFTGLTLWCLCAMFSAPSWMYFYSKSEVECPSIISMLSKPLRFLSAFSLSISCDFQWIF